MNVYDYMDKFAEAIRDNTNIRDYCVSNFQKGLLIRIDDDQENMLGSREAPYCLLMSDTGGDDSPVSESSQINIRLEVGTKSDNEKATVTTARTASANGLEKLGNGEKVVDLYSLIVTAIKGVNIDSYTLTVGSSVDVTGSLFFPLALAVSSLTVSENKDMSEWS